MKVGVWCEFSGRVRDAFLKLGHDAVSCDLLPTESPGPHLQGDIFSFDWSDYDLIIAHPPCTYLCLSGNRWYAGTKLRKDAALFVCKIWRYPVKRLCIENPVGVLNSLVPELPRPQYIHPWEFGHGEVKKTGLWLRGLPSLIPTRRVSGRKPRIHYLPPSRDRGKLRSLTYLGIARAMARQWGVL